MGCLCVTQLPGNIKNLNSQSVSQMDEWIKTFFI